MSDESADPRESAHHPRRRVVLRGHERAEQLLLRQYKSGRMHHGWLLSGASGIGKATLAYRLARFVLHFPDPAGLPQMPSLGVPAQSAVAHRVGSGGHPDLVVIERRFDPKTGRIKSEIAVDDVRKAGEFFSHTAGAGGWRVCVVDSADDLNAESANALLKTLEEPPERSLIILVSHQPRSLLATIRSRCIEIGLTPLSQSETVAVLEEVRPGRGDLERAAFLSRGSPGRALEIMDSSGAKAFESFAARMERFAALDFDTRLAIADAFQGRGTADDFAIFGELLLAWAGERARAAAMAGKGAALARAHDAIAYSIRLANALNLDRRQTVLDALSVLEDAAKAA
jgi:DNA polymerase-3 subunit delta'